ncbi:MAG TPA: PDZ domain-containing protein [Ktedonobacteraceae bacterium]|nr:PDZ domain-containing protein [Ktedonobacteraceae bacterium]
MANIETDKLELVQPISARDVSGLFKRTLSSKDGFCIEVFRGERHLGSIISKDESLVGNPLKSFESLGVRRDDALYRVSLGGKLFTLEGIFTTSDNLHPGYKAVIELAVTNSSQFIMRYRQQDDPERIALAALEGELRRYASLRFYNRLKSDELGYRIEHTLNVGSNKTIGLDVVCVHDVVILADPHEQKKRAVIQEEEIKRMGVVEGLKTDTIKNEFERGERQKDDEENWHREQRDAEQKRLKVRLDGLADILMIDERNRIRDLLDADYTQQQITQMHPEFGMAFPALPSSNSVAYIDRQERLKLASKGDQRPLNDEPLDGQVDVDRVSPHGTARQKIEALSLHHLGFTLLPITPTRRQRESAALAEDGQAFLITLIDDAGIADAAGLSIGDIVVGVNEEIVSDAEMLVDALKLRDHAGQIALRVLRGRQLISLTLDPIS